LLLTISTTHQPATDLGFLLAKNPARTQSFPLSFGKAHVFYPEVTEERCTAALLLEVDPVGLVRGRKGPSGEGGMLEQYVNDRPYVASSFLSVALSNVFGTGMSGRSRERPELAATALPLEARLPVVPCRGGEVFLRGLFEPLGYEVAATHLPLDSTHPDWGESSYFDVTLRGTQRLSDLLSHLYVLMPVLDRDKHYWIGDEEVEKLLRHGSGWLAAHPEREAITQRYLRNRKGLVRDALARLAEEDAPDPDVAEEAAEAQEEAVERRISLNTQRLDAVVAALREQSARRVLDLGCGEGRLLQLLLKDRNFEEIAGLDVSYRTLEIARDRLHLDRLSPVQQERLKLLHGALTYRDRRLEGYDAAAVVEVIEHLDPARLAAFERVLFEFARPATVVLTTPNQEYNVRWESLPAGKFRHRDHRFEWSRAEFQAWATGVAERFGYVVEFRPVGPEDAEVGSPTQMALFARREE
jgi:3' terminal RNA ribose 2'-O-methyltransferase Hen1